MKHTTRICRTLCAALVIATAYYSSSTWAAEEAGWSYIETSVGFTRPTDISEGGLTISPEPAPTLSLAFGKSISSNARLEAEVAYAKVAWDTPIGELTVDGINVGANLLYDIEDGKELPALFEIGLGLGWFFGDEVCAEIGDGRLCGDADLDDWNVQAIVGISFAVSDTGSIVTRYRLQHIGGFNTEDRVHVFTVGYRHRF